MENIHIDHYHVGDSWRLFNGETHEFLSMHLPATSTSCIDAIYKSGIVDILWREREIVAALHDQLHLMVSRETHAPLALPCFVSGLNLTLGEELHSVGNCCKNMSSVGYVIRIFKGYSP